MLETIFNRRSIRKYQETAVSKELIEQIIQAGIAAPSAKNRQPWKFVVVSGMAKEEMIAAFERGMEREKGADALMPNFRQYISSARHTLSIMRKAPVTIFVMNTLALDLQQPLTSEERIYELCNAQSIGAALENMTLAATELGLGSLWICDTYFAQQELMEFLNTDGDLIAAMTIGYADQSPDARPRNELCEIVEWRE